MTQYRDLSTLTGAGPSASSEVTPRVKKERPFLEERSTVLARRSPVLWTLASLLTLGLGGIVWHYKINEDAKQLALTEPELARQAKGWSPGLSVFALITGGFLVIPAFVTIWRTWSRVRLSTNSDRLGAGYQFCMTFIPIVNIFHHAVLQSELNLFAEDEKDNTSAIVMVVLGLAAYAAVAIAIVALVLGSGQGSASPSSSYDEQTQDQSSGTQAAPQPASTDATNGLPGGLTWCSPGLYVNAHATCSFARNVAASYDRAEATHSRYMDRVYSPVTGLTYSIGCHPIPNSSYAKCYGPDSAGAAIYYEP